MGGLHTTELREGNHSDECCWLTTLRRMIGSVAVAGICREAGRSMATLTSQRQIWHETALADRGPGEEDRDF